MIIIIDSVRDLYIFSSFVDIAFIIILEFVLRFLDLAIRFDFIEFILRFLNLVIEFDFIDDIMISEIKRVIFIKGRILIFKVLYKFKIKLKIVDFIIEGFNYFFKNK